MGGEGLGSMGTRSVLLGLALVVLLQFVECADPETDTNAIQKAAIPSPEYQAFEKKTCKYDEDCAVEAAYPKNQPAEECSQEESGDDCVTEKRHGGVYRFLKQKKQKDIKAGVAKEDDHEDLKRSVTGTHKELEKPPEDPNVVAEALRWVRGEARVVVANATSMLDETQNSTNDAASLNQAKEEFEAIKKASEKTLKRLQGVIDGKAYDPDKVPTSKNDA